jgi:hypothetical protein
VPFNDVFSTYAGPKQAEIIRILNELFKGNERFHGAGDIVGAKWEEDKNKWKPGNTRAVHKQLSKEDWHAHLSGERFIGISPLLDDGTIWFACIDVDKLAGSEGYDFDYHKEMDKIKRSNLPLVVYRTKSGGLRVTIFFSEPVEAEIAIKRMQQIAAQLGYAGNEIFPKQFKLSDGVDYPGWIFLPYGPHPEGMFPEQCCMNESGNPMEMYESVIYAVQKRITRQQFFDLFVMEMKAKANGKANGKNHPRGMWVAPNDIEPYSTTINTIFHDGPPCLWTISHMRSADYQHNFLLNCITFFKRKYPENWEEALLWVNENVLRPRGNQEKFLEMKKNLKTREYEYTCRDLPICEFCNSSVCKNQPFGIKNRDDISQGEWGPTIVNRIPRLVYLSLGTERIPINQEDLLDQRKFQARCLSYGLPLPFSMPRKDWEILVRKNLENATIVEPSQLMRSNDHEYHAIEMFFGANIPSMVRSKGDEFLAGKIGDRVRVRAKEGKIYFKRESLLLFCERSLSYRRVDIDALKMFLDKEAEFHQRDDGKGWFRSSYSIRYNQLDSGYIEKWMNPDAVEEEEDGE